MYTQPYPIFQLVFHKGVNSLQFFTKCMLLINLPHLIAECADDKAIISINSNPIIALLHLQYHLTLMEDWYTKWRFKINQSKSIHSTFVLRLSPCPEVIYGTQVPTSTFKYLGLTLDRRLTWAPHLKTKRLNFNCRLRLLKTFCNKN